MKSRRAIGPALYLALTILASSPVALAQMNIWLVEPASASAGTQVPITIYGGDDCAWHYLNSTVHFSPAVSIVHDDVELLQYNVLTTTLTIPADAVAGPQTVTVSTLGFDCVGIDVFEVTCDGCQQASLLSAQPEYGNTGGTLDITILGQGTHFDASSRLAFSGSGINVLDQSAVDPATLTATIAIAANAPYGRRDASVTTGAEVASGDDLFEVVCDSCGIARLVLVTPDVGYQGTTPTLTITGDGTHFDASSQLVLSGSGITVETVTPRLPTVLDAQVSIAGDAPVGMRTLTVVTAAERASASDLFQVASQPVQVTPDSGIQGEILPSVTIQGGQGGYTQVSGVNLGPGIAISAFSAPNDTNLVLSNLAIAIDAPVGRRDLVLSLPGGPRTLSGVFAVLQGPDTLLLSIDPDHGDRGHPGLALDLVGQNTHFDSPDVLIEFSGSGVLAAPVQAQDGTHLTARVVIGAGAGEGVRDVTVQVGQDCDLAQPAPCERVGLPSAFSVTPPGSLDSADPALVQAGLQTTVTLTGTDAHFEQGRTVLFLDPLDGLAVGLITVATADQLQFELTVSPEAAGDLRDVKAVTGPEVALGPGLLDVHNPQIRTVAPAAGFQGLVSLPLTISGTDIPFAADSPVDFSGAGITVLDTSFDPAQPDQLGVRISIAIDAPVGRRDVTVTAAGLDVTAQGVFLVMALPEPGGEGCGCTQQRGAGSVCLAWLGLVVIFAARRRLGLRTRR